MESKPRPFLVVDDDKDFCSLLTSLIDESKFVVASAQTLTQAQHLLDSFQPEVVLLDNHLPDGRGIDFIKVIKLKNPNTNIIMVTADVNSNIAVTALEKGVNHFLSKPFSFQSIRNILDKID